jgi:hypothetical protein
MAWLLASMAFTRADNRAKENPKSYEDFLPSLSRSPAHVVIDYRRMLVIKSNTSLTLWLWYSISPHHYPKLLYIKLKKITQQHVTVYLSLIYRTHAQKALYKKPI